MIKYAHRGLVKNGKLPFLFYQLYLLMNVVFYSLWLLLAYFSFLFSHADSLEKNVLKTFKGEWNIPLGHPVGREILVHQYWHYFATSMCIFLMLLFIMSVGIFYSKRNLRNHCHSRQNVFTFNSTIFWGLTHIGLVITFHVTILHVNFNILHILVLRFFMIFSHIIKSFVTFFENQNYFPELFSDTERSSPSFYYGLTNICPRPETLMPFIPFRQNAR